VTPQPNREGPVRAKVQLSFIRPGKPNENAYIESFNGKFRESA
jgi:transposase InsO family protein